MFEPIPTGPACLMVVDFQTRLFDVMPESERDRALRCAQIAIAGARALALPVIVTEQYPKGLGSTHNALRDDLHEPPVEKLSFSAAAAPRVLERLEALACKEVLVLGMETHICVLQTVHALQARGLRCHVLQDAVLSRRASHKVLGCDLMRQAGAVISSTEIALFGLLGSAEHPAFKTISRLVR